MSACRVNEKVSSDIRKSRFDITGILLSCVARHIITRHYFIVQYPSRYLISAKFPNGSFINDFETITIIYMIADIFSISSVG